MVTSDRNEAVGLLMEDPTFVEGSDLLRAARVQAAQELLRRSGFTLILLGTAVQMKPRRWWQRGRKE